MKKATRLLCLMLAFIMVLGVLVSCKKGSEDGDAVNVSDQSVETIVTEDGLRYDENGYLMDDLPETYNFGEEYYIYSWSNQKAWEWCEELTNKSTETDRNLWKRQNLVEERFGVTFKFVFEKGEWDNRNNFISRWMGVI